MLKIKKFSKASIFFGVIIFMLYSCAANKLSLPDRSGNTVRVTTEEELHQAILNANPYETVIIADGIYQMKRSLLIDHKIHLTLRGESGDATKVILQGGGWGDFYNGPRESMEPNDVIIIRNSEDVAIADLTITEASHYGIVIDAESKTVSSNPKDIQILRCHFINIATRGLKGTASKDQKLLVGGSVRFCRFENTKVPEKSWYSGGNYITAIDMMYLKDWVFSDNVFKNMKGATGGGRGAIFIWNQSRNIVVERNVIVGCDRSISFGNPSEPTLYEPGTLHNYDGIIRNNFIVPDAQRGTGIEVVWADNVQVCHNTIYAPNINYGAIRHYQKISRLLVSNNLVRGRIYGDGDVRLEGNFTGEIDGYFVNPAAGDLHLTKSAVEALGKGLQLSSVLEDIDGQKRKKHTDLGADQK